MKKSCGLFRFVLRGVVLAGVAAMCHAGSAIDPDFGSKGIARLQLDGVEGHELRAGVVLALPDGKLLFGGSRNRFVEPPSPDPHMRAALARMNADGSPDDGFGSNPANPGIRVLPQIGYGAVQQIEAMQRFEDGSVVIAGSSFALGPSLAFVSKVDANGQFIPMSVTGDPIFALQQTGLHAVAIDAQGRIVVGGERSVGGLYRGFLARIGTDGMLDTTFGANHDGTIALVSPFPDGHCYVRTIAIDATGRLVAGGFCGDVAGTTQFSVVRFDADGLPDGSFAGSGWRLFRMPGDTSISNEIEQMRLTPDGGIVLAAYHDESETTGNALMLKLRADGAEDPAFGDAATPGYRVLPRVADAQRSRPSALLRLDDGRLLAGVSYVTPQGAIREHYAAVRLLADGRLDENFGQGGLLELDPLPAAGNADLTAMAVQAGRPILAGSIHRTPTSSIMDIVAVRLQGDAPDDVVFADGFDRAAPSASVSTYDDLAEGFYDPPFHYDGVTYREVNDIAGVFPTGETFTPDIVGTTAVVERAVTFFPDYPGIGSAPNLLTFGPAYVNGDNFSIGPLARATMDLDDVADGVKMTLVYYQNGPWGGIELHLDAYRSGVLVGSDQLRIDDSNPGRDDMTTTAFEIGGVEFDQLKLYATWQGQPSAPRVMIDDLTLVRAHRGDRG